MDISGDSGKYNLSLSLSVTLVHTFFQEGHGFLDDLPSHDEVSQEIFSFFELAAHGFEPSAYAFLKDCFGIKTLFQACHHQCTDVIKIELFYCSPDR